MPDSDKPKNTQVVDSQVLKEAPPNKVIIQYVGVLWDSYNRPTDFLFDILDKNGDIEKKVAECVVGVSYYLTQAQKNTPVAPAPTEFRYSLSFLDLSADKKIPKELGEEILNKASKMLDSKEK